MARFRKGTNDADNDGRQGGSLKAGTRFVKGTNDPDNDGNRGGSLPKGDTAMVKVKGATGAEKKVVSAARKAAKSPQAAAKGPAKPAEPVDAEVSPRAARKEALAKVQQPAKPAPDLEIDESIGRHPGGIEPPISPEAQFAHADGVGDPRVDEIAAGMAVRGY